MAGSSGFFDATELADGTYDKTYVAEQFAKYFSMFVGNGVFANPANQLKVVSADNGMYVTVKAGRAFINGYWFELDADYTFAVQINDTSTNDRIDGVFVQLDTSEGVIDIVYEAGRSEVNRTAPIYELKLCDIAVPIASTQVTDAQITDKRAYDSVCGFVANLVQITSTEELFTQWTTAYNEWYDALLAYEGAKKEEFEGWESTQKQGFLDWMSEQQGIFSGWRDNQEEDFMAWYNRMKDQLSEDAAGNLQSQIDDLEDYVDNTVTAGLNNEKTFHMRSIPITIPTSSFVVDGDNYKAEILADVHEIDTVEIVLNSASVTVANTAYVLPDIEYTEGKITIYSKYIPGSALTGTIIAEKTEVSENE